MAYDFHAVESKWQKRWKEEGIFCSIPNSDKPKFYCFEYPPYPSGSLHVGHVRNYTIGDVIARFKRMSGYNVLYTQGFDSFGLPNEIAAIENNIHPKIWTRKCIKEIKNQFVKLGYSYDTDRFVTYHNETYYKWTQWLFLLFLKNGLAYKRKASANWCEKCGTVLADDQVDEGKCWRCDSPVQQKYLDQWFFAIQKYADKLLSGLDKLEGWPERIKAVQKNWFGRSEGVEVIFQIPVLGEQLPVFTTTPELIYGCTFVAISPDHPLIIRLVTEGKISQQQVAKIKEIKIASVSGINQKNHLTDGIPLNLAARNPLTGKDYPIYIASYIQSAYGTGAIFCVPAHDKADFEFAKKHNLPSIAVIESPISNDCPKTDYVIPAEEDILVNSNQFSGLSVKAAKDKITEYIISRKLGRRAVHYRVRDWLISRQRYWGPPIPVIYCNNCGMVPVPESELPVKLPKNVNFKLPGNPLDRCEKFIHCRCYRCHRPARRETDTMDTFVNSSWFYIRYCTPRYHQFMFDKTEVNYWMPADVAIGGVEHATTVYIHDRFVTKVLNDLGLLDFDEPFLNLLAHELVVKDGKKMSKSLGNTVDPNQVIEKYGTDALRMAILFIAPPEKKLEWKETMLKSCHRFLNNLWELVNKNADVIKVIASPARGGVWQSLWSLRAEGEAIPASDQKIFAQKINQIIKEVTDDLNQHHFNTCVHSLFKLLKLLSDWQREIQNSRDDKNRILFSWGIQALLLLLVPFAPHLSEELWEKLDFKGFACEQSWPKWNEELTYAEAKNLVIQINGKIEAVLKEALSSTTSREEIEHLALNQEVIMQKLDGSKIVKEVFIEEPTHSILNIVTEERSLEKLTG